MEQDKKYPLSRNLAYCVRATRQGCPRLLVFCLLYTPCVAAIASIRREMGRSWALFTVVCQCGIAWTAALAVHLIGLLLGAG